MYNPLIQKEMNLQFGELAITPAVVERLHELGYTIPELQEAIADHKSSCDGEPSVYVGTYSKYNDGSLCGLWIDLSSFSDYDEFINFCKAVHADEEDPELMAQDFEEFPREWYNEGFITRKDFEKILEYVELCDRYGVEAVNDYMEFHDTLDDFEYAYCGRWEDEEAFAMQVVDECYPDLSKALKGWERYFDYEAFGRELFMWDYSMGAHGHVFRRV